MREKHCRPCRSTWRKSAPARPSSRASRAAPRPSGAYASDWMDFARWCERAGLPAMPAAAPTVGAYLSDRTDFAASTRLFNLARSPRALMLFVKHLCWF
jgi:hypothetical protein